MRAFQLTEASLQSIRPNDVVDRKYISDIINGIHWDATAERRLGKSLAHDNAYDILDSFRHELPDEVQQLDDDNAIQTPEFRQLVTRWATARFGEVKDRLGQIPRKDGKIVIHRVMRLSDRWFTDIRARGSARLGIFWTYDVESWDSHSIWGSEREGTDVLVEALVDPQHVDWADSIRSNMDWYSGDEEYELRLFPRVPLEGVSFREHDSNRPIPMDGVNFTA